MVSQTEQELATACEFEILTGRTLREETEFKVAVVHKVNEFPDDKFDALSEEAQEWIDLAIDRLNSSKPPPPFLITDFELAEEEHLSSITGGDLEDEVLEDEDAKNVKDAIASDDSDAVEEILEKVEKKKAKKREKTGIKEPRPVSGLKVWDGVQRFTVAELHERKAIKRKMTASLRIRELIIELGLKTPTSVLQKRLIADGFSLEAASITFFKYEIKATMDVLRTYGMLKED